MNSSVAHEKFRDSGMSASQVQRGASLLQKIREWTSNYISIEENALFKDPDWPHLWDKA